MDWNKYAAKIKENFVADKCANLAVFEGTLIDAASSCLASATFACKPWDTLELRQLRYERRQKIPSRSAIHYPKKSPN